jgi:hypothetical protein
MLSHDVVEEELELAVGDALGASGRKGLSFLANSAGGDVGLPTLPRTHIWDLIPERTGSPDLLKRCRNFRQL